MVMQVRRTPTAGNPPSGLAEGQLAIEMASAPPKLWCGVPAAVDPGGRILLNTPVVVGAVAPVNPANGDLWWHSAENELYIWLDAQSAWVKPAPSIYNLRVNVQTFLASGTYTPSANMVYAMVECIGGGGAGGSCIASASIRGGGGGGGSGGYSRSTLNATQIGASQVVTIGAGGPAGGGTGQPTSFGALVIANAGGGGGWHDSQTTLGFGGSAANRGTGQVAHGGTVGGNYVITNSTTAGNSIVLSGNGAAGYGGGAGLGVTSPTAGQGSAAGVNSGGGGSGAVVNSVEWGGVVVNGGAGGSGMCIVTEYIFG